ncbi:MAG: DUF1934 domain-containing protein [Ruminococcaceae bacterium]|nr:DUF1934 domain-containing protein [Oscillospiraceae bacterium]
MKDVLVKVKTVQIDDRGESDTIELTAEGKFAEKDGSYLIKYSDAFISGDNESIQTTVKVGSDGAVSVTRSGSYQSRFVIEKQKRCNCLYQTPYGTMTMGFYGEKIENNLNKNGGELSLRYTVDVNGSELNRNQMTITIKEV